MVLMTVTTIKRHGLDVVLIQNTTRTAQTTVFRLEPLQSVISNPIIRLRQLIRPGLWLVNGGLRTAYLGGTSTEEEMLTSSNL
ncbi:hypothetical protein J6590_042626 [Homalodisca vitripennis]|nr:hypothetical protein J6590_042626 [Homalodisca vitripennis]